MNIQAVGMFILLGALIYLWWTVSRLNRALRLLERRAAPPGPAAVPPPAGAVEPTVVAAIAAAVALVVKGRHRIVAVHPDAEAQHAWSAEGRRDIYHSHKVR
jgi:Na+-transporting methylmalonyl-CoA/oxaloacetate decarboxylase gamma subunit